MDAPARGSSVYQGLGCRRGRRPAGHHAMSCSPELAMATSSVSKSMTSSSWYSAAPPKPLTHDHGDGRDHVAGACPGDAAGGLPAEPVARRDTDLGAEAQLGHVAVHGTRGDVQLAVQGLQSRRAGQRAPPSGIPGHGDLRGRLHFPLQADRCWLRPPRTSAAAARPDRRPPIRCQWPAAAPRRRCRRRRSPEGAARRGRSAPGAAHSPSPPHPRLGRARDTAGLVVERADDDLVRPARAGQHVGELRRAHGGPRGGDVRGVEARPDVARPLQ